MMFPICASLAKAEHIAVFNCIHLVENGMGNVSLQFADKIMKDAHLDNGHKAQAFQKPALAGSSIKRLVEDVEATIRPGFAFKMVYSQFAPPRAGWLGMRQC